jgi:hypothetical protein
MTEEVRIKDDQKFEEIRKSYTVVSLPEDHFLRERFKIDSIRIYDRSLLFIQQKGDDSFIRKKHVLLKEGEIMPLAKAKKVYAENGIWTTDDEAQKEDFKIKINKITEKRDYLIGKRDDADSDDEREKFQKELDKFDESNQQIENDFREIIMREFSTFSDTIEMQADEERTKTFLLYAVCKDEGDDDYSESKRLWKTREEFNNTMTVEGLGYLIIEARSYWEIRKGVGEIPFFGGTPAEEMSDSDTSSEKKVDNPSSGKS